MKNLYIRIPEMQSANPDLVLATVAGSSGSTPQKAGNSALFNSNGLVTGTVGGGIVEGRAKEFAISGSRTKVSGYLHLSLDNDISSKEQAICGGEITILIDASPFDHIPVFMQIKESLAERIPGVLITHVNQGTEGPVIIKRHWMTANRLPDIPDDILMPIREEVQGIIRDKDPEAYRRLEFPGTGKEPYTVCLLEPLFPSARLIIAGAGHIGKALSHLGKMLDFDVTVVDDRREFANTDNLPDADHIFVKEIGSVIGETRKDADTYIVIVTRGHKDDASALKQCIGSQAAYVGMIGSRTKVGKMRSEFIDQGWATEEQWSTIFSPVGLDIRSKTVEEIAVSIAAEIIMVKNRKK